MKTLHQSRFEHFGINVMDIKKMEKFYCTMFGFVASDRGKRFNGTNIVFLTKSANDHHQLVLIDGRPPEAEYSTINQISFGLTDLDELRNAYETLIKMGIDPVDIIQIDHGNAWSFYTKDPEGNPLELFCDSPWHTPQPCRGDLDISKSSEVIMKQTEKLCRSRPGFSTREEWSLKMEKTMARAVEA
ncbi:MAG: ring-cleaving dioxygenase [Robiginitomaculum sp.]|nr:MAG: ring-cleaving dioxygenase [Robiginitomaculum sp.]